MNNSAVVHASAPYWFVIPAAGIGSRFGAELPKQYALIDDRSIIEHSIERLLQWCPMAQVVVALAENDIWWAHLNLAQDLRIHTVIGGRERVDSVFRALEFIAERIENNGWVLVHDAARPCIDQHSLDRLVHELKDEAVGGLLAIPVADTLKKSDVDGTVVMTVDRSSLWAAQTPQMFRFGVLFSALKEALAANLLVTDEASAVESQNGRPVLVEGDSRNIKVTRPEDIDLARFYIINGRS